MDVITNIKNNNTDDAMRYSVTVGSLLFISIAIIFCAPEYMFLGLIGTCICGFLLFKKWKKLNNVLETDIFKKYGSPEELTKIVQEIESTLQFEFNKLRISENYISDKDDYRKILRCDDILGIHKLVHRHNGVIDYVQIVLTDKWGKEIVYQYSRKKRNDVDEIIPIIAMKCRNAYLGYSTQQREYIRKNKVNL